MCIWYKLTLCCQCYKRQEDFYQAVVSSCMIKHTLSHAFGYKMLLNQDCSATALHFIWPVCRCSNAYRRDKALTSRAFMTLVIRTQLEWGGKKKRVAVSQGALKASQWGGDIRKANTWLRNWGTSYLLYMMRTSKDSMKASNSWLEIYKKELFSHSCGSHCHGMLRKSKIERGS